MVIQACSYGENIINRVTELSSMMLNVVRKSDVEIEEHANGNTNTFRRFPKFEQVRFRGYFGPPGQQFTGFLVQETAGCVESRVSHPHSTGNNNSMRFMKHDCLHYAPGHESNSGDLRA